MRNQFYNFEVHKKGYGKSYHDLKHEISKLHKENKQLQNNWNQLKKSIEEKLEDNKRNIFLSRDTISTSLISCENDGLRYSLNKMQELEQVKDEIKGRL